MDTEINERLFELYKLDCQQHGVTPSIKDYVIWLDEQEYDAPELEQV